MEQIGTTLNRRRTKSYGRRVGKPSPDPRAERGVGRGVDPRDLGLIDKWQVLRDLTEARDTYGLKDRTLTVLQALLSCHKTRFLRHGEAVVVFPSNRTLSARANGIAESTLRRHLGTLVESGLITRRDSPNRKRYRRRTDADGLAFGFDLEPLVRASRQIAQAAEDARNTRAVQADLRDTVRLLIQHLSEMGHDPVAFRKALRRKLDTAALQGIMTQLRHEIGHPGGTDETNGSDSENERHIDSDSNPKEDAEDSISLRDVLQNSTEMMGFTLKPVRSWQGFESLARTLAPDMGLSAQQWENGQRLLGKRHAAILLADTLEATSDPDLYPGTFASLLRTKTRQSSS